MKFFDKEFSEALQLNPIQQQDIPNNPNPSEIEIIPLMTTPTASEVSGGCQGVCSAASSLSSEETAFTSSGIQSMLTQMLQKDEIGLDDEDVQKLTDTVEWDRLENIIQLSQLGDGWDDDIAKESIKSGLEQILEQTMSRRTATMLIATGLLAGFGLLQTACNPLVDSEKREEANLNWQEYFKGNFRLMTDEEKETTVTRLERLHELQTGNTLNISAAGALSGVLYGYAFNISKCRGYLDCIRGCIKENNQDRQSDMRYIRIHEHQKGHMNFDEANDDFFHEVPAAGHFYIGTQCFQCENPPCVNVCPVKATWKEPDGIVVVDYDWCIGCRYCLAACPYDARRFNWADPVIPEEEVNRNQHYLGNRLRKKGVTEKCTFCIQRTRTGKNPACVEACPTGARIFGNLLDPESDIRWVLKNKKVFRLKEDLGTEPKFWYFMD